jgi:hypothetical protein
MTDPCSCRSAAAWAASQGTGLSCNLSAQALCSAPAAGPAAAGATALQDVKHQAGCHTAAWTVLLTSAAVQLWRMMVQTALQGKPVPSRLLNRSTTCSCPLTSSRAVSLHHQHSTVGSPAQPGTSHSWQTPAVSCLRCCRWMTHQPSAGQGATVLSNCLQKPSQRHPSNQQQQQQLCPGHG